MVTEKFWEMQKSMTFKEKIDYLWYYYKLHFIIFLFATISVTYLISGTVNSKEAALNVVFIGESFNTEQLNQLNEKLDQELISEQERDSLKVTLQNINLNSEGGQQALAESQKFAAQLAAGSIDVLISDKQTFALLKEEGRALDLREATDLSNMNKEKHELITSESGQVIGISTSNMGKIESVTPIEDKVLYAPSNANNVDRIGKLIEFLTVS